VVINLVPPELFLEKVQEVDADVLAMSAMVSVAVSDMGKTICLVKDRNLPTKLIPSPRTTQIIARSLYVALPGAVT